MLLQPCSWPRRPASLRRYTSSGRPPLDGRPSPPRSGPAVAVDDPRDAQGQADQRADREDHRVPRPACDEPYETAVDNHAGDQVAEQRPARVLAARSAAPPPVLARVALSLACRP